MAPAVKIDAVERFLHGMFIEGGAEVFDDCLRLFETNFVAKGY